MFDAPPADHLKAEGRKLKNKVQNNVNKCFCCVFVTYSDFINEKWCNEFERLNYLNNKNKMKIKNHSCSKLLKEILNKYSNALNLR